jgi:hypothetical protein
MRRIALVMTALMVAVGFVGSPVSAADDDVPAFCDVGGDRYYADAVAWAKSVGITSGVNATAFAPDAPTTRGQIVTLLHRYVTWRDGVTTSSGPHPFADIPAGAYFADAVGWAAVAGITTGVAPGRFAPDDATTRAQLATFVHRMVGAPSFAGPAPFDDIDPDDWYGTAVAWMAEEGLTTGTAPRTFSPMTTSSRAEVITFLWRLSDEPPPREFQPAPCPRTFLAIGDSVMGGTRVDSVLTGDTFPGWVGIVDALGCRQAVETVEDTICGAGPIPSTLATLQAAAGSNALGDVVIIHVGTNGPLESSDLDAIIAAAAPADTIWLTTIRSPWSNQVIENQRILAAVARWNDTLDIRLLDWSAVVDAHPEALDGDGMHLSLSGRRLFTEMIGDALAAS